MSLLRIYIKYEIEYVMYITLKIIQKTGKVMEIYNLSKGKFNPFH